MTIARTLAIVFACAALLAAEDFPAKGWRDAPDPIASPDAVPGGELVYHSGPTPKSLNYYTSFAQDAGLFFGLMFESLLGDHPVTMEKEPGLADRWSISEDKLVFTFHLDPAARWSDGRPVTARDVKWTCDAIADPKNETGPWQMVMDRFAKVEVVDEATVRFTGKEVHWSLLDDCGGLPILPSHVLEGKSLKLVNTDFPVVSGPYRIAQYQEHQFLRLERRQDWWGWRFTRNAHKLNFASLKFKFHESPDTAFDAFLNGDFDVCAVHKAAIWVKKTEGERFANNWIVKQKVRNKNPLGFQGWAMNTRKPPFDDVRVRKAMCLLLDRATMNATMLFDQYFLHRSYVEDLYDAAHPCPNPPFAFDKDAARGLLAEAGWTADAKTGRLQKDGKPLAFTFLTRDEDTNRFLAVFDQALASVGVTMTVERKDWASWQKDMDAFAFQMTWAAWGGGVKKDPEGQWSSREADRPSGNNLAGLKLPAVDALIARQKPVFDLAARHAICREVDALVYKEYPYILLWNIDYERLLYWNKFGTPRTVLSKYGDAASAIAYWWLDPDAVADLAEARKAGKALPRRPAEVSFEPESRP